MQVTECAWVPNRYRVVRAVRRVVSVEALLFQDNGEVERRAVPGRPVVFDERADCPGHAGDKGIRTLDNDTLFFHAVIVPLGVGVPVVQDRRDAGRRGLLGPFRPSVLHEGVERMETLTDVMRIEDHGRFVLPVVAVERERHRAAVGVEAGVGELLNSLLVDLQTRGILGVEQRVQVPARHMALQRDAEIRLRKHCYSKVGHVLAVRVEDAAHGISRQLDGPDYVGGIHVGQSCHNTGSLAGSLLNRGYSTLPYDNRTVDGVTGSNRRERRAIRL